MVERTLITSLHVFKNVKGLENKCFFSAALMQVKFTKQMYSGYADVVMTQEPYFYRMCALIVL